MRTSLFERLREQSSPSGVSREARWARTAQRLFWVILPGAPIKIGPCKGPFLIQCPVLVRRLGSCGKQRHLAEPHFGLAAHPAVASGSVRKTA